MKYLGNSPLLSLALVGGLLSSGCSHPDDETHTPLAKDAEAQTYVHLVREKARNMVRRVASTEGGNAYYRHTPTGACYEVYMASSTLVSQALMNDVGSIISSEDGRVKLAKATETIHCQKERT